ncbi:MAG: FkbM family methyltransferase [Bacteroidota bacterium]|nr:FkbM family methyltransferase [Bacteroidota bacterium]
MLAQYIFDQIIKTPSDKKLKLKILKFLRAYILKNNEPLINYQFFQFKLSIFFSHDFPFNLKDVPEYSQNLGKIALILSRKYPELHIIDVGANVGDSAAIIKRKIDAPILCIEGNPRFLDLLEKNTKQFNSVSIEKCFVGDEELTVTPVNSLGTAYLEKSENGIAVKPISSILNKHQQFAKTKLLKIDTDGFDNKIIRGSRQFLIESKSSVFFEYDPYYLAMQNEKGTDIYDFLVGLNYTKFIIFDNLGDHLITLDNTQKEQFEQLHHYFDRRSSRYMDIWALHKDDNDITYSNS